MSKPDYQTYLASREWAILKNAVRERAGGICERCRNGPIQSTHHLTYARIYHEELTDLIGVCDPCHKFLSAKTEANPIFFTDAFLSPDWWVYLNPPFGEPIKGTGVPHGCTTADAESLEWLPLLLRWVLQNTLPHLRAQQATMAEIIIPLSDSAAWFFSFDKEGQITFAVSSVELPWLAPHEIKRPMSDWLHLSETRTAVSA